MSAFSARKTDDTSSFFRAFLMDAAVKADTYDAVAFGTTPEMADELVELALLGIKRATASLAEDYGPGKERLPAVGDYVVACDGRNKPRFVWRTTEITVKPLNAVDDAFAFDEGEGKRTRDWWLDAHRREFAAEAARKGYAMSDEIPVVFERFTIVWPRLFADGPKRLAF